MQIWNLSASFTRPNDTTAYASGDLVANSTTANQVVPLQLTLGGNSQPGTTRLTRVRLAKSSTGVSNATFRVHLYESQPTPANGDNGAWSTDQSVHWLGNIDIGAMLAFIDGASGTGSAAAGSELLLRLGGGKTLYALIEARGAYTPAAQEQFTLTLESLEAY
jgi:hypothetical protein